MTKFVTVSLRRRGVVVEAEDKPFKSHKFETFSDQIAAVDHSIVYQLAGTANIKVDSSIFFLLFFSRRLYSYIMFNLRFVQNQEMIVS